jgi:isopenicillin N synthase-like dioxygenase
MIRIRHKEAALARSLGKGSSPDYREGYKIGVLNVPDGDPYYHPEMARKYFPPNVWPPRPAGFRRIYGSYYSMERLAADLMRVFALALELDEGFLCRLGGSAGGRDACRFQKLVPDINDR